MGNRFQTAALPLATRETGTRVVYGSMTLYATCNRVITSSAAGGDIRLDLLDPTLYPGLDFELTHAGDFITEVLDENGEVIWSTQVAGRSATIISDGTKWLIQQLETAGVEPPVSVELRIFDTDTLEFRQATSMQDAINSTYALTRLLIDVMREEGAELPAELEEFYGNRDSG